MQFTEILKLTCTQRDEYLEMKISVNIHSWVLRWHRASLFDGAAMDLLVPSSKSVCDGGFSYGRVVGQTLVQALWVADPRVYRVVGLRFGLSS